MNTAVNLAVVVLVSAALTGLAAGRAMAGQGNVKRHVPALLVVFASLLAVGNYIVLRD